MQIPLSPKHGVNPSLLVCPVCGKDSGVALCGRLPQDAEAPHRMLDQSPCPTCEGLLSTNILFHIIADSTPERTPNPPILTSAFVPEETALAALNSEEIRASVKQSRRCYVHQSTWERLTGAPLDP
jgi:hypothetical protein